MNQQALLWCNDCKQHKPEKGFSQMSHRQARGRGFRQPQCKDCARLRQKSWRVEQHRKQLQLSGQLYFGLVGS